MGYARTRLEEATDLVKALEKENGELQKCAAMVQVSLEQERDALQRACAEMRDVMERCASGAGQYWLECQLELSKCIHSSTCGQGYKSPAECEALQKENEQLKKACVDFVEWSETINTPDVQEFLGTATAFRFRQIYARLSALVKEVGK